MRETLLRFVFLTALVVMPVVSVVASTPDDFHGLLQQGVDQGIYRGLAVGWIDGSKRTSWFLGKDDKPDAQSEFELGAVTQVFTGLLLAQAVFNGKVRLDTTVGQVLGSNFSFADHRVADISLQSLAFHRTGIRAIPSNLFPVQANDPYAGYSSRDLLIWLANALDVVGDDTTQYSIVDAGLLGYLVAHTYAGDFKTVVHDRVLVPLKMSHTGFSDGVSLLNGYSRHGAVAAHWHFDALAGAAGLRSTLPDMLDFVQQNLRPDGSSLRAPLLLARRRGNDSQSGLGWNVLMTTDGDQSWPLVWSASVTGGFASFIGFRTDRQQGLVLLGNSDVDLSAVGLAWLEGNSLPDLPRVSSTDFAIKPATDFTGLYQAPDHTDVIVRDSPIGLTCQWPGQVPIDLQPVGQDIFVAPGLTLTLSFQRESGKVTNVVIEHAGVNVLAKRLSTAAPHLKRVALPISPSLLGEIAGEYRFDVHGLVRVRGGASGIWLQMTARPAVELYQYAKDRFFTGDDSIDVELQRDAADRVIGLNLDMAGAIRSATRVQWRQPTLATQTIPTH